MPVCSAFGCNNRSGIKKTLEQKILEETRKITFHVFPKEPTRKEDWIKAVRRVDWLPTSSSVLCSEHFTNDSFDRTSLSCVRLREMAVPSIFKFPYLQKELSSNNSCTENENRLSRKYEFKQESLQNITYEKYAQQITPIQDSSPEFVHRAEEILDEHNYATNIFKSQTEIVTDIDNSHEVFIKEEANEGLLLDDKLQSLLHEVKQEDPDSNDSWNINEYTNEQNVQIPNDSVSISIKNENIREQENHVVFECYVEMKQDVLKYHNENLYDCEICNKSFRQSSDLTRHRLIHTGVKPFSCEVCNKSFKLSHHLKRHCLTHSDERPFSCGICNKTFRQLSNLNQHKLLHTGEKPFTCDICNEAFRRAQSLKMHKTVHTDKRSFSCDICNKSFRHLKFLEQHKLTHTDDEEPFSCEVCDKTFRRLSYLIQHKLIHIDKKPLTCEVCNMKFDQSQHLKQHKLVHTDGRKFFCEVCNKAFKQSSHLNKHKLIHSDKRKPYACEVCNKSFRLPYQLEKHKSIFAPHSAKILIKENSAV